MEIQAVLYSNIVAAVLAVTSIVASASGGGKKSRISGVINVMVLVLLVMICLEIFNFWSNGKTMSWVPGIKNITTPLHNFFTVFYPGLCCIMVYEYSYIRGKSKKYWVLLVFPSLVWAVVLIINHWKGFVFTIDSNMVYHRGNLVYFTFVMPFIYYLIGIIMSYVGFSGNRNFLRFPIWIFALPALGFMVFQALTPGVSTIHIGLALGLCGACLSIQKERMYIDSLTGIYNRSFLFYIFSQIEKKRNLPVGAIMLDINDFKHINDEFGHQQGDIALTEAALILSKSLQRGATAIRFAGDEFVVIIRRHDVDKVLGEIVDRIKLNTEILNNTGQNKYKLQFAIGSSVMREDESPDDLLLRIDEKMYQDKKNKVDIRKRA